MRRLAMILPVLALSACATPETRVRNGLIKAGLSEPVASCMAERMVDRLSLAQLQRLGRLVEDEGPIENMSIAELGRKVRALGDPEIISVVTSSGVGCAIAA